MVSLSINSSFQHEESLLERARNTFNSKNVKTFGKKADGFMDNIDKHLVNAEDAARVPEAVFIGLKELTPQNASSSFPVTSLADGLGAFRGGVSSLRIIIMAWNVVRGKTFEGGLIKSILNVIHAATRTLVLVNLLQRYQIINLPRLQANIINFSVSIGFTILSVLSFIDALSIWHKARNKTAMKEQYDKYVEEITIRENKKENVSERMSKEGIEIEANKKVMNYINQKGHDAASEFLEAFITPLDTGLCSHNASPYFVVPMAILGGISALVRLWRTNAPSEV